MGEVKAITVRMDSEIIDEFKNIAKEVKMGQGKLLADLITNYKDYKTYSKSDNKKIPVKNENNENEFKLLLTYYNKYNIEKELTNLETIVYKLKGKLITWIQQRPLYEFTLENLNNIYGINESKEEIFTSYQFGVYIRDSDKKYVVYESIYIVKKDKNEILVNIKRCKILNELNEITKELEPYINIQEIEQIKFCLCEVVEDDDEKILRYAK